MRQDRGEVRLHPPVNRRPAEERGAVRLRAGQETQRDHGAGRTGTTGMYVHALRSQIVSKSPIMPLLYTY